MIKNINLI